ncbi:hypothetical protein LCGC14_0643920 [marine sediment metagenome]|uniref:Uncharacterized protein n=1 Tax=marine sediment metagenome TaxID=412755 RepID=A0A0F9U6M4_9ZZZZ
MAEKYPYGPPWPIAINPSPSADAVRGGRARMSDKGITHYVGDDCQGGHYQDSRIADLERQLAEAQGKLDAATRAWGDRDMVDLDRILSKEGE